MVLADDIRKIILKLAEERGSKQTFTLVDVARMVDEKNWKMMLDQVGLVVSSLVTEGKIIADQAGKAYFKNPILSIKSLRSS